MECPTIRGLKLDHDDILALEDIRRRQRAGRQLEYILPAGVIATIFLGNSAPQTVYNIQNFDFVLFSQAMSGASVITRRAVHDAAARQVVSPGKTFLQRQFWMAIADGCEVN